MEALALIVLALAGACSALAWHCRAWVIHWILYGNWQAGD
jgi:hypothetical protein